MLVKASLEAFGPPNHPFATPKTFADPKSQNPKPKPTPHPTHGHPEGVPACPLPAAVVGARQRVRVHVNVARRQVHGGRLLGARVVVVVDGDDLLWGLGVGGVGVRGWGVKVWR